MTTPKWVVKNVVADSDYKLFLTFADGTNKVYDAMPLLDKKIYYGLKNPEFFMKAKADCGTVVWDDNTDIAPEHLYEFAVPVV